MSRARVLCQQGHLHANAEAAEACDIAWRIASRKRLGVPALAKEILKALARRRS